MARYLEIHNSRHMVTSVDAEKAFVMNSGTIPNKNSKIQD